MLDKLQRHRRIKPSVCMLSCFSCVQLFATQWTVAHQAPLSMGFSRQKYRRGLPFHTPGDLPNPGIETASLISPPLAVEFFTTSVTWGARKTQYQQSSTTWRKMIQEYIIIVFASASIIHATRPYYETKGSLSFLYIQYWPNYEQVFL